MLLKNTRTFVAIYILCQLGCVTSVTKDEYIAVVQSAKSGVPIALEMEDLFGKSYHSIVHFNCDSSPKTWQTLVYFGQRYELVMEVEVIVNCRKKTVSQTGTPKFHLSEAGKVEGLSGGRFSVTYNPEKYLEFTQKEWDQIYRSRGDWNKIGYSVNKQSVPDFDKYESAFTKDIIRVTLMPREE